MTDPLSQLRQYNIDEREILEKDGYIIFGDSWWPKDVKTNCIMWKSRKEMGSKDYYTLESLLFFLRNIKHTLLMRNLKPTHPEYCRLATAANIPAVRRPDREKLLLYLNGKTANFESIDKNAPTVIPIQVKRQAEFDGPENLDKKVRLEVIDNVQEVKKELQGNFDEPKAETDGSGDENHCAIQIEAEIKAE